MNKAPILVRTLIALSLVALLVSAVQRPAASADPSIGSITTLYANDPLQCSLDLRTGQPGMVVQEGEVRNRDSHLCLGYFPDSLTVAIQGRDTGAIADLGSLPEAARALSVPVVGNSGDAYVALHLAWARAQAGLQKTESVAHAPVRVGHLYVVRIVNEGKPDLFAKLIVLDFEAGAKVTIRWQMLGD
jgi:hypothetical protein